MLRKNTAGQNLGFALLNASTGAALTGATVTAMRVIDGGTQAAATGTVTEKAGGQYGFAPSAADLNGNQVSFLFTASGAVPVEKTIVTTAADPTSATSFGLTNLDATVSGVPAAVWANATRTLTAFSFNPVVTLAASQPNYAPALAGTAPTWYAAPPTDYQQRGVAVTLPTTAPAGWIVATSVAAAAFNGKGDWNTVAPDNTTIGAVNTLLSGLVVSTDHAQLTAHALALAPAGSGSGAVTVAGYAAGQDPATLLFAAALPPTPTAGTAGEALKFADTRLDAAMSTRLATAGYTAPDNADVAAIKVKTDALPAAFPAVDGSGHVTLAPAGLDQVKIEGLYNARQVLGLIASLVNGLVSGMDTDSPVFKGLGAANSTTRASYTTDANGNRLTATLTPEA